MLRICFGAAPREIIFSFVNRLGKGSSVEATQAFDFREASLGFEHVVLGVPEKWFNDGGHTRQVPVWLL